MKITAIGVNAAFATGVYDDVITVEKARCLLQRLLDVSTAQKITAETLAAELAQLSEHLYRPKWQSNFLIEFDMPSKRNGASPYRLLLDAGGDVRHALKNIGLSSSDIDGIYISHPHADHIGGIEYMGLTTLFNPAYTLSKTHWLDDQFIADKMFLKPIWWSGPPAEAKPDIFVHRKVLEPLKRSVGPGLDTVQGIPNVSLDTYFDIHIIGKQENGDTKTWTFQDGDGQWTITPIFAMHVISSAEEMASYGLSLEYSDENGGQYNILMPTDTQHMLPPQLELHYKRADRIYMDCETSKHPSGVHPHISELIHQMAPELQRKCLLYHYDAYPDVPEGMFYGILKTGDFHIYPPEEIQT